METGPSPAARAVKLLGFGVAAVFVSGALVFFGGCAVLVFSLGHLDFGHFDFSKDTRKHLKPIPIDKRACPYVKAMHVAAYDFELANPDFFRRPTTGSDKDLNKSLNELLDPKQWKALKAKIDRTIVVLDLSMRLANPHLPRAVQTQLATVHESLHLGRIQLHRSKDALDAMSRAATIQNRGQTAFGNASDLIGRACGAPLGF